MSSRSALGTLVLGLWLLSACSKPHATAPENPVYSQERDSSEPLPQRYESLLRRFVEHDRRAD